MPFQRIERQNVNIEGDMQEEYALKHKICHMRQICVHTVHTENENIFEDKKRKFKFALAELFFQCQLLSNGSWLRNVEKG